MQRCHKLPSKDALLAQIADSPLLPTPPGLALQILDRASRPDCTIGEIVTIVQTDPALCGRLLKTTNSALFNLPRAVTSVEQAVKMLGTKTVRSLVLCHSLPALRLSGTNSTLLREYWKSSLAGAVVGCELARARRRPDPEDVLVAGLLRDLGLLLLYQLQADFYGQLHAQPPVVMAHQQCQREEEHLGLNHAEVSAFLLQRWRLPQEITEPIRLHHHAEPVPGTSPLVAERAALLYFATRAAQLLLAPRETTLRQQVVDLAQARYGMSRPELGKFLEPIHQKMEEFAALLQVDIGTCERHATLLMAASEELAQLTVETCTAHQRLDQEKNQAEQQARHWRRKVSRLRREVVRDPLTGAYNRKFLEEALETELKRARRRCTLLGLLFIDLDGFKLLNDHLGHLSGDRVLKQVAATLQRQVRAGDLVARYGGDEFCVLVEDVSEEGIRCLAQRLAEAIPAVMGVHKKASLRLGASVGAVICAPHRARLHSTQLLRQADEAMYAAKNAGKNRVTFLSLLSPEDGHVLQQVHQRLFSVFLLQRQRVGPEQLAEAARLVPTVHYPLGRLARKLGWLSPGQLRHVLQEQRRNRNLFGECALALGYLVPEQLYSLLALQREYPEELAQSLVDLRLLTPSQAHAELCAHYQALQAQEYVPPVLS